MGQLDGRTALVTGGARGIGKAIGTRLGADGAHVIVFDVADGSDAVTAIAATDGSAAYHAGDVRSGEDLRDAVDGCDVDILVNNAAYYAPLAGSDGKQRFDAIDADEWDDVFAVNVKGPFLAAKTVLPQLEGGDGSIVNISSDSILSGVPGFLHYVSSKAALIGMTRGLANEVGNLGIRVNAVMPGVTASEASLAAGENYLDTLVETQAIKERIEPEDIADVVAFLAGPDSAKVTGEVIVANAGRAFD